MILWYLFRQMRPVQWTKNALVLAAFVFTIPAVNRVMFLRDLACLALFCAISGAVYILNDLVDLESDRKNPAKANRPLASGVLSPIAAAVFGVSLTALTFVISWFLSKGLMLELMSYAAINVAYSLVLKHVALVDLFCIAAGFVLRAVAGATVIQVPLTPWFLLCALLLSLLLATGKRKHELAVALSNGDFHRPVLQRYSMELLNQLVSVTSSTLIMTYALFTFYSGHTPYLMLTIPLVLLGLFRYFQLIVMDGKGGKPEVDLFRDKGILATGTSFAVLSAALLWWFG